MNRLVPLAEAGPKRESHWRRLDPILVGSALCLSALGSLLVWSATRPRQIAAGEDPNSYLYRHLAYTAVGIVLCGVVTVIDYRKLRTSTPVVYLASCLGLVGVLLIGTTINGAHSWIVLGGGVQLQPSEFAKIALVVGLALLFAERAGREDIRHGADVPMALCLAAVPMGLIMLQPDLGTTMVFVFVIFAVFLIASVPIRWIGGLVVAGVLIAGLALRLGVLEDYQLDRFRAFANPEADARGAGYNITQARIAIGAGGLTGTGLFQGTQTNGRFVPEQHTDFVFTVAGEELGLIGAGGIIVLFGLFLWRALRLAGRSPDMFGKLATVGVAAWIAFQSFVNIGMTIGIMPVTGVPLPFVSYGGSATIANWLAVGLLLNVYARTRERAAVG